MRMSFALPALAGGLVLGWAAVAAAANASPPPAAPIIYCPAQKTGAPPTACKPAQAPVPHPTAAHPAPPLVAHAAEGHRHARYRHERRYVGRFGPRREDVSASQAFIYRYERAQHGFDARAAEESWEHAGPPPCPEHAEHGCPPSHHEWAEAPPPPQVIVEHAPPAPQQVIVERAPPPPQQIIIEREAPPPPKVIIEHAPAPPPRVIFEQAPRPPCCREEGRAGGSYLYERHETERAGGWRYAEQDGQRHYESWGDVPHHHHRCPPPVGEGGCSGAAGGAYASGEAEWRDGSYGRVYPYSGRDAYGYLVWPGKTAP